MVNKYYQKHKERLRKKARERYQNFTEEEREKGISIIRNVSTSYLRMEKIII